MIPKAVLKIATLGTDHRGVDLVVLGDDGERPERALLRMVAGLKLQERVRWIPLVDEEPLPEPCEADDVPMSNWDVIGLLEKIIEHKSYRSLAKEWLQLVHQRGEFIPYEAIPLVLSQLHWYEVPSSDMRPVLCKRAKWLIRMNDTYEWAWVMPEIILTISPKQLSTTVLHRCLAEIRKTDPDAAREYLQQHWSEIDDKRVIGALDTNLGEEDIAFIDQVFDIDGDGPIDFGTAGEFAAQLPDTRIARKFLEAIRSTVKVRLNTDLMLEVDVKATTDTSLKCFGMETVKSVDQQIFRYTPPFIWYDQLDISATEFADILIEHSTLGRLDAMVAAAEAYGDEELAISFYLSDSNRIGEDDHYLLATTISHDQAEQMILSFLDNVPLKRKAYHPAHPLLYHMSQPWSEEISKAVVEHFAKLPINMPFFGTLRLEIMDRWIPGLGAEALRAFEAVLDKRILAGGRDAQELMPILEFLDFRKEMYEALYNGTGTHRT